MTAGCFLIPGGVLAKLAIPAFWTLRSTWPQMARRNNPAGLPGSSLHEVSASPVKPSSNDASTAPCGRELLNSRAMRNSSTLLQDRGVVSPLPPLSLCSSSSVKNLPRGPFRPQMRRTTRLLTEGQQSGAAELGPPIQDARFGPF